MLPIKTRANSMDHLNCTICCSKQSSHAQLQSHYIIIHKLKKCMNCNVEFSKLGVKHFRRCKRTTIKKPDVIKENSKYPIFPFMGDAILCLMCFYQSCDFDDISKHYLQKHHLKCIEVEEPDFDQVFKKAPYRLEQLENYAYKNENKYDIFTVKEAK